MTGVLVTIKEIFSYIRCCLKFDLKMMSTFLNSAFASQLANAFF